MGLSVANQVDMSKYFSLATIKREQMQKHGIKITMKKLREIAKTMAPAFVIYTGDDHSSGKRRQVNIYKYEDFSNLA